MENNFVCLKNKYLIVLYFTITHEGDYRDATSRTKYLATNTYIILFGSYQRTIFGELRNCSRELFHSL